MILRFLTISCLLVSVGQAQQIQTPLPSRSAEQSLSSLRDRNAPPAQVEKAATPQSLLCSNENTAFNISTMIPFKGNKLNYAEAAYSLEYRWWTEDEKISSQRIIFPLSKCAFDKTNAANFKCEVETEELKAVMTTQLVDVVPAAYSVSVSITSKKDDAVVWSKDNSYLLTECNIH